VRDSSFFLRRESLREESAPPTTTSPVSTLSRSLHAALSLFLRGQSHENNDVLKSYGSGSA
jgi:hypothetical protein